MPRPRNDSKHLHHAVNGLVAAMQGLLKALGALSVGGVALPRKVKRPKGGRRGRNAKLRSVWANHTPAHHHERGRHGDLDAPLPHAVELSDPQVGVRDHPIRQVETLPQGLHVRRTVRAHDDELCPGGYDALKTRLQLHELLAARHSPMAAKEDDDGLLGHGIPLECWGLGGLRQGNVPLHQHLCLRPGRRTRCSLLAPGGSALWRPCRGSRKLRQGPRPRCKRTTTQHSPAGATRRRRPARSREALTCLAKPPPAPP